jgi:15-cis-phytoene synthase
MNASLAQSYAHCRRIARTRAKNFYYSFVLLSATQRDAMCAVYAFMRHCDDLSDDPSFGSREQARAALEDWRQQLARALAGDHPPGNLLWPALHHAITRFGVPHQYLYEMVEGVTSDLDRTRIATFDELYRYCYLVASVAGITTIHILGFRSPDALQFAEKCGIAFQLTNILRDVQEDAAAGRIYLPAEDLQRFGVSEEDIIAGRRSPALVELLRFESARAEAYYRESLPLIGLIDPRSRGSLKALMEIYWRLLRRIEHSGYDVFSRRIRLSTPEKLWVVTRNALDGKSELPSWLTREVPF